MLVGAGRTEGAMDAANILKPALARGAFQFCGATTLNEYRQYIEKDGALARRLQPVLVEEPSVEDTVSILRGIKDRYETFHKVRIMDSAVVAAANMAKRYFTDRKNPDKALDLLDESASRLCMQMESKPDPIAVLEREIMIKKIEVAALKGETDEAAVRRKKKLEKQVSERESKLKDMMSEWEKEKRRRELVQSGKSEIEHMRIECENAIKRGDFARAGELTHVTIPRLERELKEALDAADAEAGAGGAGGLLLHDTVTADEVAAVVARHTGIPLNKLLMTDKNKLSHLDEALSTVVVGQDEAIRVVSDCVRVARAGLQRAGRPQGVFLFVGPTGTGKTELCKALAANVYGSADNMVRIDMSEYSEKHSVSKLIGAPPGYVGYDDGSSSVSEMVRRRPYVLVLFDEIEKADKEVLNILLQVMDDGFLTDSHGRKVDFSNTMIVMTSNLGAMDGADAREMLKKLLVQEGEQSVRNYVENVLGAVIEPEEVIESKQDVVDLHVDENNEAKVQPEEASRGSVSHENPLITRGVKEVYMKAVRRHLTPEFLNRIDDVVVFAPLGPKTIRDIVHLEMAKVDKIAAERRLGLKASDGAVDYIADKSYDERFGGRLVKRVINREITVRLAKAMVEEKVKEGDSVYVCRESEAKEIAAQVMKTRTEEINANTQGRSASGEAEVREAELLREIIAGKPIAVPENEPQAKNQGVVVLTRRELGNGPGEDLVFVVDCGGYARKAAVTYGLEDSDED